MRRLILVFISLLCSASVFLAGTALAGTREDTEALLREIAKMQHIRVRGLMTVAPFVENQEENREVFRQMRELLVDMNGKKIDNIKMDTLSMGMTGDYEVAIEEGATIVRVGTGIFGERYYPNKG